MHEQIRSVAERATTNFVMLVWPCQSWISRGRESMGGDSFAKDSFCTVRGSRIVWGLYFPTVGLADGDFPFGFSGKS